MALIDLKFYSETLGMQAEAYVVIPQRSTAGEIGIAGGPGTDKYRCLYLLHGLSDDHSIWLRRTSIERYATEYGIAVVMPCAHKSFYTDMKYGMDYYTYIAKELPARIHEFFNISDAREDNFIAGISMGGYGALKIGLREPEKFCAAAGLSSVADIHRVDFRDIRKPIFGDTERIPDCEDLFYLAEQGKNNPNRPRLYMTVGTEDFMYEDNLRLRDHLQELPYDYTYTEGPGGHTWEFWDDAIQKVLKWML